MFVFKKEKCSVGDGFEGFKDGGQETSQKIIMDIKAMIEAMERKGHGYKVKIGDLEISWTLG